MSNDLTGNPYIIDTASSTAISSARLKIAAIRWYAAAAAAGNTAKVTNSAGQTLWYSVATGANYVEAEHWSEETPCVADGLTIPTLDAGTLYILLHR